MPIVPYEKKKNQTALENFATFSGVLADVVGSKLGGSTVQTTPPVQPTQPKMTFSDLFKVKK